MRVAIGVIAGLLVGGCLGYFLGAYLACAVFNFWGNLCGLFGAFITGPLGGVGGAVAGWFASRRR
jgi:hypothetical protein